MTLPDILLRVIRYRGRKRTMPVHQAGNVGQSIVYLFNNFRRASAHRDYTSAAATFEQALDSDPAEAFRYFAAYASGPLASTYYQNPRARKVVLRLDELRTKHPYIHYLSEPADADSLARMVALREDNINRGLPSMVIVPQAKSGSVAVASIFHSGFRLPSVCYSFINLDIIDSWARDFARGGACYATHLLPSHEKVSQLKSAGIDRMIVHVRDPRQTLVSLVHHADRYPDDLLQFREKAAGGDTVSARASRVLDTYQEQIQWIEDWVDLEHEIDILFSTHEQFVTDKQLFVERYLDFYSGDRKHFSYESAVARHPGTDYHFRSGQTDEWREVLDPTLADRISAMLPTRLKIKFGWPD